jgi:uncharacterized protein
MSATLSRLPRLGVGLGFRSLFLAPLLLHRSEIDFLEIVADHYLDGNKRQELDLIRQHFTLIPHALDTSLGSVEGVNGKYIDRLARLIDRLEPPYWSEHLAFTQAAGIGIGHLTPVAFTEAMVEVFVKNIQTVRKKIGIPLILENITYPFLLPDNEMSEAEFITQIATQTDCGLLLDATNLYINSLNHGFAIDDFLAQIPTERVVQLHFVGGHQQGEWLIDSHSQPTPQAVIDLMEAIALRCPNLVGAILERDENLPPFDHLTQEIGKVRKQLNFKTAH